MSGEPNLTTGNIIHSTKSGAKRIFQMCEIPIAMSAYDISDRNEFELALARLITNNLDVNTWIFKIDDEFGSRGTAFLNVDSLKTIQELRRRKVNLNEDIIRRLQATLCKLLPKKTKFAHPTLWSGGFEQYMAEFCRVGGVIECAPPLCALGKLKFPSVSFLIEPDGETKLIGSFDKFHGPCISGVAIGCTAP